MVIIDAETVRSLKARFSIPVEDRPNIPLQEGFMRYDPRINGGALSIPNMDHFPRTKEGCVDYERLNAENKGNAGARTPFDNPALQLPQAPAPSEGVPGNNPQMMTTQAQTSLENFHRETIQPQGFGRPRAVSAPVKPVMQANQYDDNPAADQVGNMGRSVVSGMVPHATWLEVHEAKARKKRRK